MLDARARNIRPANEIRKVVQQTLHKRPFQSWERVEYGFSLIGVKDFGKSLRDAHGISVKDMDELKVQLNKIVARRNQIVHEGTFHAISAAGRCMSKNQDDSGSKRACVSWRTSPSNW